MAAGTKTIADPSLSATSGVDLAAATTYGAAVAADSDLRTRIWSELVTRDAREKNVFAKFIGGEGSGKPIVEKTDLSAGGSDKVTFTTVAPIRGQGVRGESVLKHSTGSLNFGTFNVEVDLIRHAVSWTQVLKLMRFTGKTLDQLSAEVMSEWAARMEQDLLQAVIRDTCFAVAGNNLLSNYGTKSDGLLYSEGLSTDIIQEAKQALIANGAQPMNTGGDENQDIPGYLFFGPDACLRPLRSDPDYLEAITQADARGADNKLYSGSYAKWDNNIIANHNVIIDTAHGRQGSPLAPVALMQASGSNGWDSSISTLNDLNPTTGDYYGGTGTDIWANWPGAKMSVPGGGGSLYDDAKPAYAAHDTNAPHGNVLIVDANGDYRAFKIAGFSATDGGAFTSNPLASYMCLGDEITDAALIGDGEAAAGTMTAPLTFYPCNKYGTPVGYILAMGENAFYMARGAVTNEQIFHYDDFANSGNDAHLSAVGVQSVYGMAAYEDTSGRIPGVVAVEAVRQVPGLSFTGQG
tara:strand:- start:13178 stop:14743 length:1566 start_codon:yes stop_codon:yes gene_type:complete